MENNIRFRNHISIILENSGRAIWTLVFVFIGSFIGDLDEMGENGESILSEVGILLAVIAVFVLIAILWQIFVWSKTYISVQDNTIVIESNTLNRKKNTIGIKNISNVNLEQNLFEMAIGTCKVKLDTNSLSTADTTDVKIIIKKEEAKAFQAMIVEKLRATTEKGKPGYSGSEGVQEPISQMQQKSRESKEFYVMQDSKITASVKEILQHGLFSTNILSVVILIGVIAGIVGVIGEVLAEGMTGDIVSMVLSMMIAVWFIAGLIWSVLKGYIKYMDFEIQRQGDKVLLSYGILKKVTYSIPVDKINAIKCSQSIQARIAGRYMVEIVNVGMGDDESEKSSFFLPYDKADHIMGKISVLLPEFDECLQIREEHQPGCVWKIWVLPMAVYALVAGLLVGAVWEFVPELTLWAAAAVGILSLYLLVVRIAAYKTEGCKMDERFLKIVSGSFGRRCLFVKYDKVQYVTLKQNFLAKHFGVQKGTIHLLAAMKEREHRLPYFSEEKSEQLKRYV